MGELDALLAEQVAYYRARAPEYLEDAGVEGVTPETQSATARAIEAALDAAAPLGDVLELACGPGTFTGELADRAATVTGLGRLARDVGDRRRSHRIAQERRLRPG